MGYVWLIIGIILVGMFAEAPWLMTGILLSVIGVFLYLALRDVNVKRNNNGDGFSDSKNKSEIDCDFVREVVDFLGGYLALCNKYGVQGHAYISTQESNEFGYNCDIGCRIYTLGGDKAIDSLAWIKSRHSEMLATLRNEGYEAWKLMRDGFEEYMEETYIGTGAGLHYCFTDPEEWKFDEEGHCVTLAFERQHFFSHGKWNPTLAAVKEELKKKFPDANITVHNYGLMIK